MMRSISATLLAVSCLMLTGCLLPEKFTAHLHIDKEQNFTFRYEGTVVFALMLAPDGRGPSSAEMNKISQEIATGLTKEPGVVSAKPVEDGRVSIVVEQRGRIRDQTKPLFGGVRLKAGADESVRLEWPAIPADKDITKVDYRLDGKFRLTTDGVISSNNGVPASAGMLGNALTSLGLSSQSPVREVSWHVTRENHRNLPMAVISGVTPAQNSQKALHGDIVFTSNVPNNDSAIEFATWYLQQVSEWKGDTIRWQIWQDAFFRGFAANATWLHREIQELKQIDLKVYRSPLTTADRLNGKLDCFKVYVTPAALRSMELRDGATFGKWTASGEVYQPLIMAVEQTAEGWFVSCSFAVFGAEKEAALSPMLDQLDLRLARVKYPMRVEPGKPMSQAPMGETAGGSRIPASDTRTALNPSTPHMNLLPGQTAAGRVSQSPAKPVPEKLNLPPKEYQERRIQVFIALLHRELAEGSPDALARRTTKAFTYNGKKMDSEELKAKQKSYREKWSMVREAPTAFVITQTGLDSYKADYLLHHWAEVRQTGEFFSSNIAISLKIQTFADGEYFQIGEWNAKLVTKKHGQLGPNEGDSSSVKGRRFKGAAHHPDYDWPFVIELDAPDSTGRFTGKITWTTLGAVHKIHGKLHRDVMFFVESEVLSAGSATLGAEYTATTNDNGSLQGTWSYIEASRDHFSGGTWEMKPDP